HPATTGHPRATREIPPLSIFPQPGTCPGVPGRDEHQLVQGAAHPRYAIRTRPAHIRTRGGCSYHGFVPVGAPPSVRTWASTFSHPTRVLLPRFHSCRSTALGANRASTYSHPGRVLLPRQVPVGAPPSVRTGQAHIRTRGGCSYHGFVPVGAPPSVRTGRAHFRTQRVLLRRAGSVGAPPSVR